MGVTGNGGDGIIGSFSYDTAASPLSAPSGSLDYPLLSASVTDGGVTTTFDASPGHIAILRDGSDDGFFVTAYAGGGLRLELAGASRRSATCSAMPACRRF